MPRRLRNLLARLSRLLWALAAAVSLLLCVAFAWLWWLSRRVEAAALEVNRGGMWVRLSAGPGGLGVAVVGRGWPGRPGVRWWGRAERGAGSHSVGTVFSLEGGVQQGREFLGVRTFSAPMRVHLDAAGAPSVPAKSDRLSGLVTVRGAYPVPPWLPVGAFALPPLAWLLPRVRRRLRRRRRRRRGLCVRCGYDLRASREAGRCPECGTPADSLQTQQDGGHAPPV